MIEAQPDEYQAPEPLPQAQPQATEDRAEKKRRAERERYARNKAAQGKGRAPKAQPQPQPQAQPQPQPESVELPGDHGAQSMKLSKREAQALLAQVFSLPASMLEPQIFGCQLIPGKVAHVKITGDLSIPVDIPEHLETTRKAAIEGLAVLLDGTELDPRWVAAGMVAVHSLNVSVLYYQLSQLQKRERAAAAGAGAGFPETEQPTESGAA
jgi:hypothetical protein